MKVHRIPSSRRGSTMLNIILAVALLAVCVASITYLCSVLNTDRIERAKVDHDREVTARNQDMIRYGYDPTRNASTMGTGVDGQAVNVDNVTSSGSQKTVILGANAAEENNRLQDRSRARGLQLAVDRTASPPVVPPEVKEPDPPGGGGTNPGEGGDPDPDPPPGGGGDPNPDPPPGGGGGGGGGEAEGETEGGGRYSQAWYEGCEASGGEFELSGDPVGGFSASGPGISVDYSVSTTAIAEFNVEWKVNDYTIKHKWMRYYSNDTTKQCYTEPYTDHSGGTGTSRTDTKKGSSGNNHGQLADIGGGIGGDTSWKAKEDGSTTPDPVPGPNEYCAWDVSGSAGWGLFSVMGGGDWYNNGGTPGSPPTVRYLPEGDKWIFDNSTFFAGIEAAALQHPQKVQNSVLPVVPVEGEPKISISEDGPQRTETYVVAITCKRIGT